MNNVSNEPSMNQNKDVTNHSERPVYSAARNESSDSITGYSRLAIRLERDLSQIERGSSVLVMAADFDRVAVEMSTELAWHLAEDLGLKVLMVDGGFNESGLTKALGGNHKAGLTDLLAADKLTEELVSDSLLRTGHSRISFLPVGGLDNGKHAPARSSVLNDFLSITSSLADFVLIQGPAVDIATRTLAFGALVDAVLLITLEGELQVNRIEHARQILNDCGAERVGLVVGASRNNS